MIDLDEKMKYVVWGTGVHAAQFLYHHPHLNSIEFFIDNNVAEGGHLFRGKRVLKFSEVKGSCTENYFFIVASSEKVYVEIKHQLQKEGYREFSDFAFCQYFDKNIAVLHGNCHMDIVREYLSSSEAFTNKYIIYPLPLIQNIEGEIEQNVLENCDLFIHQDIQAGNGYGYKLSDEYILPKLKEECVKITVPNLFGLGKGFFPQMVWNEHNPALCGGKDVNGIFPHGDIIIDRAVAEGKGVKDILLIMQTQAFSTEVIQSNFWLYMDKIKQRERGWDIAIYSFILDHYKNKKLFYDQGHPTNAVMKEIVLGVLEKLGITDRSIFCDRRMNSVEEFVYDAVRDELGMEWEDDEIRKGKWTKKLRARMTKEEYVKEYLFWCYGISC